jgi:hypothetical protein
MTNTSRRARLRRYIRHGTLPQLAAFEAAMRHGNATKAAEALCIAQPTISGQLRKLEEALDLCLFEQRGKRLVATAAGLAVLEAAHEIAAALERCEDTLEELRLGPGLRGAASQLAVAHRPHLVRQGGIDTVTRIPMTQSPFTPGHGRQGLDDRKQLPARAAAQ